jgi:hypothetical protein
LPSPKQRTACSGGSSTSVALSVMWRVCRRPLTSGVAVG